MTYDEYKAAVSQYQKENPTYRLGQCHFNVLADHFPALYDEVRGSHIDPFFDDDKVPAFLLWLQLTHPDTF